MLWVRLKYWDGPCEKSGRGTDETSKESGHLRVLLTLNLSPGCHFILVLFFPLKPLYIFFYSAWDLQSYDPALNCLESIPRILVTIL